MTKSSRGLLAVAIVVSAGFASQPHALLAQGGAASPGETRDPHVARDAWRDVRLTLDFAPASWGAGARRSSPESASGPTATGDGNTSLTIDEATLSETADADADEWRIGLAPYVWMASLTGSGRVSGVPVSGTVSFSDIWKHIDLAGQAQIEAKKGKWSLFVDGMFMELSDDVSVRLPVTAEARLQFWLFQWGAFYEFANISLDDTIAGSSVAFEAMAGNRVYRMENRLRLSPGSNFDDGKTWIDPIIGLRIPWKLPKNLSLVTRGDIGGFGLGSHFSWQAQSTVRYDFETRFPVSLVAGYRILGFNFSEGSGSDKFELDVRFYGPVFGLGVSF